MKKTLLIVIVLLCTVPTFAANMACANVAAGSPQKMGGAFDATFSATQVIDIDLSVLFRPGDANQLNGDHVAEVRIYTPKGNLYQSISVPFSYEKGKKGEKKKIEGYPQPIATQVLEEVMFERGKFLAAKVTLPVAGTPILNNSLYGVWSAEAFIDGQRQACAPKSTFIITE